MKWILSLVIFAFIGVNAAQAQSKKELKKNAQTQEAPEKAVAPSSTEKKLELPATKASQPAVPKATQPVPPPPPVPNQTTETTLPEKGAEVEEVKELKATPSATSGDKKASEQDVKRKLKKSKTKVKK